jgi:hypothetical protein
MSHPVRRMEICGTRTGHFEANHTQGQAVEQVLAIP